MRVTTRQVARYLAGGVVNTIASLGLYYALQLFLPYQLAYAIAWVFGVTCSYFINLRYVFASTHSGRRVAAFFLIYVLQYVVGAALLAVLVEGLGVRQDFAPVLVVFVTVPLMFLLSRRILPPASPRPAS